MDSNDLRASPGIYGCLGMAGSIQIRLYNTDDIPILDKGADSVENVVRWRAEMAAWALERGLMPYIVGPLPGGATARELRAMLVDR